MATISDWYESQELVKTASAELAPGEVLLKQAGITKEAGWLGKLLGKALGKIGKWSGEAGESIAKSAPKKAFLRKTPESLRRDIGEGLTVRGKKLKGFGGKVVGSSQKTTNLEDLARFYESKYFKPTAIATGVGATGLGAGYLAGKD